MSAPNAPHRFAVSRLHLPDGTVLKNQIIETKIINGKPSTQYHPLTEETPFTEWRGGDFYLPLETAPQNRWLGYKKSPLAMVKE